MLICGMEKTSMVDYGSFIVCTVFTGGCNMRCPFCHNSSLVVPKAFGGLVTEDEVFGYLKKRVGILDGVCITGGEPTLQRDLYEFTARLKDIGYDKIKLDTNGTNPAVLGKMLGGGTISYVAMDIKNSKEKYGRTVGIESFDISPIEESVRLLKSGGVPFELRTTVANGLHTPEDIDAIGRWVGDKSTDYYLQKFKKGDTCIDVEGLESPTDEELKAMQAVAEGYFRMAEVRGM